MTFLRYSSSALNRYFCKQVLLAFLACLIVVLVVVNFFETLELLRRSISKQQVTLSLIAEMVVLKIPHHLHALLPFVFFVSLVMTFWRLNITQQFTACRTLGISLWAFTGGLCIVPVIVGGIYLGIITPFSSALTARLYHLEETIFKNTVGRFSFGDNGVWFRETVDERTVVFHSPHGAPHRNRFQDVSFYHFSLADKFLERIDAKQAWIEEGKWVLENANHWNHDNVATQHPLIFMSTSLTPAQVQEGYLDPTLLSFWQLPSYIKKLEKHGLSATQHSLYWYGQMAKIGLMMAMVFLSATFCFQMDRYHSLAKLMGVGLFSGFIIHFLSDLIYALGMAQKIPTVAAAWLPSVITFLISAALLLHVEESA